MCLNTMHKIQNICLCYFLSFLLDLRNHLIPTSADSIEVWNGKWFPNPPITFKDNYPSEEYLSTNNVQTMMGIKSKECDDGRTNLTIDWDNSPINYTCFELKSLYLPKNIEPILKIYNIPKQYQAPHACMNEALHYTDRIPTFGKHRPLWAKFGEYKFLPVQRWLHNLEHGCIVLLYHPCVNVKELMLFKNLVKNCLYRHIITPYTLLTTDYPFALVSWGYSLEMSMLDQDLVITFMKEHALKGPEMKFEDGQYDYKLISHAGIVSDKEDSHLCPNT